MVIIDIFSGFKYLRLFIIVFIHKFYGSGGGGGGGGG